MKTGNLPLWATYDQEHDIILVDPDKAYPLYLEKLGYDLDRVTQAQLETARLCFTEDLHQATGAGKLNLRILRNAQNTWRLSSFPPGTPISWAGEYRRIGKKAD